MTSHLFTTIYLERNGIRRAELDYCLAVNAMVFDHVRVMAEGIPLKMLGGRAMFQPCVERQTYAQVIAWANELCGPEDLCVIANCDVVIPQKSIEQIDNALGPNDVFCLARYDVGAFGAITHWDTEWSQDVWAFRGPPRPVGGQYHFGVPGCDNRFAHELREAGYDVTNPSKSIVTLHLHQSGRRTATNHRTNRIPEPYFLVPSTKLESVNA